MKKRTNIWKALESVSSQKFDVTEDEMLQVKGGYAGYGGGLPTFSVSQQPTVTYVNGHSHPDTKDVDTCIHW